jgi:REP element-mobilizing transposase RayT
MPALAHFLTFSTYGTHLPGSEKGWIDAQHSVRGSPILEPNPMRQTYWQTHLKEPPWTMREAEHRQTVLEAICFVCTHRQYAAHALHVRTTHVHAVIGGQASPERMLSDFKAYATRALRRTFPHIQRTRYRAHHGSTRYLWDQGSLQAAVDYVLNGQGNKMACYPGSKQPIAAQSLDSEPEA